MGTQRFKARMVIEWEYEIDMRIAEKAYGTTDPVEMAKVDFESAEKDPLFFLDCAPGGTPHPTEITIEVLH